ncbi:MAG: hypothetical protein AB7S81_06890 [Bdellovibrionales bacterium]
MLAKTLQQNVLVVVIRSSDGAFFLQGPVFLPLSDMDSRICGNDENGMDGHGNRIWYLGKIGFAYLSPFIKKISVIPDKRPKGVKIRNPIFLCPELATFIFFVNSENNQMGFQTFASFRRLSGMTEREEARDKKVTKRRKK